MKKFYMILVAIVALTMTAQAQNFATVNVGNIEDAEIYNGSYFDMAPTNFYVAHTGAQMLYTPDLLASMNGKQNVRIKSLDFWFSCETFEEIFRNVKIYLQETDATEFAVNEDGIKQFFTFGEPAKEMEFNIDLMEYYYDNVCLNFDFEPFTFTPGKSLLVTMVFDAEDDDNCTMGNDYAAFYTSGIRGKAMTYTNNWSSFVDYAAGTDFPNATATLGCGTNVELPVTTIGYNYDNGTEPTIQADAPEIGVTYGVEGNHAAYVNINTGEQNATIYYSYDNANWSVYNGQLEFTENGTYTVYAYVAVPGKRDSEVNSVQFTVSPSTGMTDVMSGKTIASQRYFNVAGQEMKEANGLTIIVTTYTDGTTSAAKVVK